MPFYGISRPGPGESCGIPPQPGRSVGYLPGAPDGPPAPARTARRRTFRRAAPPNHRPDERSVDRRPAPRPAGRPTGLFKKGRSRVSPDGSLGRGLHSFFPICDHLFKHTCSTKCAQSLKGISINEKKTKQNKRRTVWFKRKARVTSVSPP